MNDTRRQDDPRHPAPRRHLVSTRENFFALFGGPAAWFVQLNAGYALASEPCFKDGVRQASTFARVDWSFAAMVAIMLIAVAVGLLAALISWRAFQRTVEEAAGGHTGLVESGVGRTRFLALWGLWLGMGFSVTTVVTAVAFVLLPRCGG